jgi:hypothetical protein
MGHRNQLLLTDKLVKNEQTDGFDHYRVHRQLIVENELTYE